MQSEPATFTPAQAEAALALAVERYAPGWAEQLLMLMVMARDAAPEGQGEAWADHARDSFVQEIGAVGDRMAAHVGATPEQTTTFAEAAIAAVMARFAELKTAGASAQPEGRA